MSRYKYLMINSIQFSVDVYSAELQGVLGQSSRCELNSIIATNDETPYTVSRSIEQRLYLNLSSSAECNGVVSSYRYCYYQPVVASRHLAVVAVYRLMGNVHEPVSETELNIELDLRGTTPINPLVCNNVNLAIPV